MTTINPQAMAFLAALRILLITIGAVMADQHWGSSGAYHAVMTAAGLVMVIGPAAWGLWDTFWALVRSQAAGVQAGLNLVEYGRALDDKGQLVPATTQLKPVTLASADKIMRIFGPKFPRDIPHA
jgi:hypothetical protein